MYMLDHPTERHAGDGQPLTVSVLNDYEVVVQGVAAMLAPFRERVEVVEVDAADDPTIPVDIALFDTFGGRRHTLDRAGQLVASGLAKHVVLYTWDASAPFVASARDIGASGVILKTHSADALVEALEQVVDGEQFGFDDLGERLPGGSAELSERESEVLALIARGFTNAEIAAELYLSVETVKTYVKRLYGKLGVHNRAQAAVAAADRHLVPGR